MPRPMDKARPREKRQRPMENEQEERQTNPELRAARLATLEVPLCYDFASYMCD